jgi:hypothetical protein
MQNSKHWKSSVWMGARGRTEGSRKKLGIWVRAFEEPRRNHIVVIWSSILVFKIRFWVILWAFINACDLKSWYIMSIVKTITDGRLHNRMLSMKLVYQDFVSMIQLKSDSENTMIIRLSLGGLSWRDLLRLGAPGPDLWSILIMISALWRRNFDVLLGLACGNQSC